MWLHRAENGVSLMEVLVALFILSVVGTAVISGVFVATKSNTVSRSHILAEGLARYECEYIKSVAADNWTEISTLSVPYQYTLPSAQGPSWNTSHNSLPSGGTEYTGYTINVTIDTIGSQYTDNITRKVNAAVSYGGSQLINIYTYVGKP